MTESKHREEAREHIMVAWELAETAMKRLYGKQETDAARLKVIQDYYLPIVVDMADAFEKINRS